MAKSLSIPVLANGGSGEIKSREDIEKFQEKTETAGVLVARAAMWNPSVFNKAGPRHVFEVVKRYCELCLKYDFALEVMKYNVLSMLRNEFFLLVFLKNSPLDYYDNVVFNENYISTHFERG